MSSCDSWNEIKGEKKMPELVPLERKKEALQNILKSALPKLTVSLPDNLREKAKKFAMGDRKSTRLNSSHSQISYAVFCLKKNKTILLFSPSSPHHALLSILGVRLVRP